MRNYLVLLLVLGCAGEPEANATAEAPGTADRATAVRHETAMARSEGDTVRPAGGPEIGSRAAAVTVLRDYYDALSEHDYARAYGHWADGGAASGQSFDAFRRGYAQTASVEVEIGEPGRIDPAAGSRYVQIPVEIRATTTGGAAQCFRGSYTLVRAVATGATAEQRHWHIYSADIEPCSAAGEGRGSSIGSMPSRWRAARVAHAGFTVRSSLHTIAS